MRQSIIYIIFNLCVVLGYAQEEHDHHHSKNEIGMATAPVYISGSKIWTAGLHFHFIHTIGESKFGWGPSYERLFDPDNHQTFGLAFQYTPFGHWHSIISPGVTAENSDFNNVRWAVHIESTYGFELIEKLHVGPVAEVAIDQEDNHFTFGIHIGLEI